MNSFKFGPCIDLRHRVCGATVDAQHTLGPAKCSCTCHNSKEEPMNFEVKTKTKVIGVSVDLTPEMVRDTWYAVRDQYGENTPVRVQWERVIKAMDRAEGE